VQLNAACVVFLQGLGTELSKDLFACNLTRSLSGLSCLNAFGATMSTTVHVA
jgi:hypothetical protein